MKIDPEDPRLTAYALGELAEAERAEVEAWLAQDEAARLEVERIRRAGAGLAERLADEPCPRLEPEQREAIHARITRPETGLRAVFSRRLVWSLALAGGAAGTIALFFVLSRSAHGPGQQAGGRPGLEPGVLVLAPPPPGPSAIIMVATNTLVWSGNSGGDASLSSPSGPRLVHAGMSGSADGVDGPLNMLQLGPRLGSDAGLNDRLIVVNGGALATHKQEGIAASGLAQFQRGSVGILSDGEVANTPDGHGRPAPAAGGTTVAGSFDLTSRSPSPTTAAGGTTVAGPYDTLSGPQRLWQVPGGTTAAGSPQRYLLKDESDGNVLYNDGHVQWRGGLSPGQPLVQQDRDELGSTWGPVRDQAEHRNTLIATDSGVRWDDRPAEPPVSNVGGTWHPIENENYPRLYDNPFCAVTEHPLSTFGLDVDTASYSNIRRFLSERRLPPRDAVRIEEMLNYFSYSYPAPRGREPFSLYAEMGECPWNPAHRLALLGLRAKDIRPGQQPPLNLVFLIDVSGSMGDPKKLSLIKPALHLLVPQLTERDRVAIVVYADNSRVVLPSVSGDQHRRILDAIDSLEAKGTTNGGEGIQSAYREVREHFAEGGINRVILCTDGDFNVGITDRGQLVRLIQDQARSGVFLNVFGFGEGNLQDATMQQLADRGNGHYAYIDGLDEARKVLVDQARATLITVAKDVKLQIEFNPAFVTAYRLIGYEKRALAARDFNNDRKDAGEMGAGHTVTALYEIIPADEAAPRPAVDDLKYQAPRRAAREVPFADEWMTIKLRYKQPDADTSQLLSTVIKDTHLRWRTASDDYRFAAAVAAFGMVLRDSPNKGEATFDLALELATGARDRDTDGYRAEFVSLVRQARALTRGDP